MAGKKKQAQLTPEEKLQQALVPAAEQPYKVPANWCWTYVKYVSEVVTGGTPSKKHTEYYSGNFPFFKPADLDAERYVYDASEYLSEEGKKVSRIIPKYSTAVCCIGSIGKSGYLEVEGTTNQQINSAIPKFNSLYLYYFIKSEYFIEQLWRKASATTISIVNKSKMEDCVFPLPPLTEQQRIVERIESLFAKLDEAKENLQNVLDSFETRKAAILHKAFTGELTANWRKQHGISMDSWEEKPLKDLTDVIGDGIHGTPIYTENGEYYFINGNNFSGVEIRIKPETKRVNHIEYDKYKVNLNDKTVFVSINGTLGKTAFYNNEKIILGKSACYLNLKENLNKFYLRYFFCSKEFIDYANEKATGSTIKNLGLKAIRNLIIFVPPIPEQTEIVRIIDDLLAKEQQAKELAENALAKIDLIKKSILARAFRGELGTNNPADEPAVELLKQVL